VGALGGLVNSEATTSALAIKVKDNPGLVPNALIGILYSNSVMLLRNLVLAGVISLGMASIMAVPHFIMGGVGALAAYSFSKKIKRPAKDTAIELQSPFAIWPSIKFGIMFATISIVVLFIKDFGTGGVYVASILGGLVSSAAVVASLASFAVKGSMSIQTAAYAGILSSMTSTLNKILLARISGSDRLMKNLVLPALLTAGAGFVSLLGLWLFY